MDSGGGAISNHEAREKAFANPETWREYVFERGAADIGHSAGAFKSEGFAVSKGNETGPMGENMGDVPISERASAAITDAISSCSQYSPFLRSVAVVRGRARDGAVTVLSNSLNRVGHFGPVEEGLRPRLGIF